MENAKKILKCWPLHVTLLIVVFACEWINTIKVPQHRCWKYFIASNVVCDCDHSGAFSSETDQMDEAGSI